MNAIRWSLATVCLSLLTACGGGGQADPQTQPSPSAGYAVGISPDPVRWPGYRFDIVDPDNAELLRSITIDWSSSWLTTFSRKLTSDGLGQTQQHEVALYYIRDGRVWAVDLRRGQSTEPRQVSSLSEACFIKWTLDRDTTGRNTWLAISTAGSGGTCGTGSEDDLAVINSLDSSSTDPTPLPFRLDDIVTSGRTVSGELDRVFTVDHLTRQLVQWRLNANGMQSSAVTQVGSVPGLPFWLGLIPGYTDRGIIQIGLSLHRLSWSGDNATLSPALASVPATSFPLSTSDATRLYVVAGEDVLSFSGTGAATRLATLDATQGAAYQVLGSVDALWVLQQTTSFADRPSSLTRVVKSSGVQTVVSQLAVPGVASMTKGIRLFGSSGHRVVFGVPTGDDYNGPVTLLSVQDHAAAVPTVLAARAFGIGTRQNPDSGLGPYRETTHVMWCDAGTLLAPVACTASRVKSYNLASSTVTSLGGHLLGAEASEPWDFASINHDYGQSPLISAGRMDSAPDAVDPAFTTTLWQFKPDVANSLTFIVGVSSAGASTDSGTSQARLKNP